jgi:hypothetical protein
VKPASVRQWVLAKAVQKFGVDETASRLQISASLLSHLIDGQTHVPDVVLLRAVDLVYDELPGLNRPASQSLPASRHDPKSPTG